jgi:exopolysaccharide production protein ExoQ
LIKIKIRFAAKNMPPHIALLLAFALAFWLMVRDTKARPQLSLALWIPWLWLTVLGSKPVYTWFGSEGGSTNAQLEGNPVDRDTYLLLIVAGIIVIVRRRVNWSELIANNKWLFVFISYLLLSTLWSEYPFVAFKRWIEDMGNFIMVLVVLSETDPVEAVKAVFLRCAFLLVPLSVVFIKYFPDLGRSYSPWSGTCDYCGVSDNKNTLGSTLIIYGIVLFWEVLDLRNDQTRTKKKLEMYSCLLLLGMVVWLFLKSNSQTSLVCTLLGAAIILAIRLPAIRSRLSRMEFYVFTLALLFIVLNTLGIIEAFVHALGRNMTFTGRTDIWQRVLSVPINSLIGTGYYSFWLDPKREEQVSNGFWFQLNESHSGYVETYLNEGMIGVGLLAILLIFGFRKVKRDLLNEDSRFNAIRLAFLAIAVLYNFTEAAFDRLDFIWFGQLLATVGFLRQVPIVQENRQDQPLENNDTQVFVPHTITEIPHGR